MANLATATQLDWPTFAAEHWDRQPVLYRSMASPPFVSPEVFATTARASQPPAGLRAADGPAHGRAAAAADAEPVSAGGG